MFKSKKRNLVLILIVIFLFPVKSSFADNKLLMITADYCVYCQIWKKEIGEIFKTVLPKVFLWKELSLINTQLVMTQKIMKQKLPQHLFFLRKKKKLDEL